jgi:hypothetical protein
MILKRISIKLRHKEKYHRKKTTKNTLKILKNADAKKKLHKHNTKRKLLLKSPSKLEKKTPNQNTSLDFIEIPKCYYIIRMDIQYSKLCRV